MTAQLPSASTRVVRTGAGIATGLDLATIWGCCSLNANLTPRLWFDSGALEAFHGPGQLLDHVSTFIEITGLPALVVPLPINTQGIIRSQQQSGTGTSTATMSVGSYGSLERVDGLLRVARGGTVGVDQIQMEYSLDGGNQWTLWRLGTGTSYSIPRIGQTVSFTGGTLVTGEEILSWTSSAPEPADADIATGREKLAAQGNQSRAWLLIRELTKEQDVAAFAAAVAAYDTTDERPLQAYAGIRRAFDRSGYKAQMSRRRSWMQGSPEITFTQGAGPPNDTITRDAGSFTADGFGGWSIGNGDWITVTGASTAGNNGSWKLSAADVLILTLDVAGALTTDTDASGVSIWTTEGLEFVDGGGGDDTLVRGRYSWLEEGFEVGDTITIAGTASNDGDYLITDLTADTITVAPGSFTAEEISGWGVSITASVSYPVDVAAMDAAFATVTNQYKLQLFYGRLWRQSPAVQMRLRYSTSLAAMARTFLRDVSETVFEKGYGSLTGDEGWGMVDVNGQPFEYDERVHRAALPSEFSCARTWASDSATIPYIARELTRAGGSDALTQAAKARVTNQARIIVQRQTEQLTGAVFVKQPPDELGRQFLTADALGTIEAKINKELARQMLGKTRSNVGPRVSRVSWVASRDDDFSVQNPVLTGKLTVDTLGVIITVDTTVEVL
jgi:hypothetical protein